MGIFSSRDISIMWRIVIGGLIGAFLLGVGVALLWGCHIHMFGKYYSDPPNETVLELTNNEDSEGLQDEHRDDSPGGAGAGATVWVD